MSNIIWTMLVWVKENIWDRWFEKVVTESIKKIGEHTGDVVVKKVDDAIDKTFGDKDGSPRSDETLPSKPKVRFKGLRSYDEQDADFYPELLPGPRGQDGIPESIRFWKTRIEQTDSEKTFRVGVIYGPSGCGKSSLMNAGILPRLVKPETPSLPTNGTHSEKLAVVPVCVEATAEDTEDRLLRRLRRYCPELPPKSELVPTLRKKKDLPAGKKVLIVLDQFEQWLHAKPDYEKTDLVQALRECDGERVQCVLLVRDDFWTPLSRFLKAMEIRQEEGRNMALVDRFDLRHAKRVLVAFGQDDGMLDASGRLSKQQAAFVQQSIAGLAQEGKIICVRLVLFAQMIKGKPWTPATLISLGGVEKVGVTFLKETFSDRNAPERYHRHEKAAEATLKALLPEQGTDIKGAMKSKHVLLQASGYARRPNDFDELLDILNSELRLITPTPPPGSEAEEETQAASPERQQYYQLTHDYLVPAVREWLVLKQKETRRGRAEILLADRATQWNSKPENRYLPSAWEWCRIRCFTKKKDWTGPQGEMMKRAVRVQGLMVLGVATVTLCLTYMGLSFYASRLVEELRSAVIEKIPEKVHAMHFFHFWTDPALKQLFKKSPDVSEEKLSASLALLPVEPNQAEFLFKRLLVADPIELPVIWEILSEYHQESVQQLRSLLENSQADPEQRFRAACALANPDQIGSNTESEAVYRLIAERLLAKVNSNPSYYKPLIETLRLVRDRLLAPLSTTFRDKKKQESERSLATSILADYASDDPDLLADLLVDSEEKPFAVLFDKLKAHQERAVPLLEAELDRKPAPDATADAQDHLAQRQARAAVALLRLERGEKVWNLLRHSPDPSVRSYIVNWLKPLGAGPETLMTKLEGIAHDPVSIPKDGKSRMDAILFHPETSERRALILALGRYNLDELLPDKREPLVGHLREMYRNDPDSGIHGAAEWTLRQWKQQEKLKELDAELMKLKDWGERRWYVNGQGQTFAVIDGPVEFLMGSPPTDTERIAENEPPRRMAIPRRFAIAAQEVTVEQFQRFLKLGGITIESYQLSASFLSKFSPDPKGPWIAPDWYTAAHYCNWLSEQEGLPKEQWCYLPNEAGAYAEGMSIPADVLQRTGYRLPTEAEWEYACRAGAVTSRYYGHSLDLLYAYAWYLANSKEHAWTCGSLFPNDLGLFDMLGNTYEWCQDSSNASRPAKEGIYNDIINISESIIEKNHRFQRGGTFVSQPAHVRSAGRIWVAPSFRLDDYGFRPSRTYH
jgi:formylglycine-generating enzyme required for sulfatase activity/energy-coupling factor transporter ATP-binding protein EcfA2